MIEQPSLGHGNTTFSSSFSLLPERDARLPISGKVGLHELPSVVVNVGTYTDISSCSSGICRIKGVEHQALVRRHLVSHPSPQRQTDRPTGSSQEQPSSLKVLIASRLLPPDPHLLSSRWLGSDCCVTVELCHSATKLTVQEDLRTFHVI